MTQREELFDLINRLERDDLKRVMRVVFGMLGGIPTGIPNRSPLTDFKSDTGVGFERTENRHRKRTERSENKCLDLQCFGCF